MASHQLATVSSFSFWRDSIKSYSEQGDSSGKSVIIWAEGGGLAAIQRASLKTETLVLEQLTGSE
jgi:hypothetical protein